MPTVLKSIGYILKRMFVITWTLIRMLPYSFYFYWLLITRPKKTTREVKDWIRGTPMGGNKNV